MFAAYASLAAEFNGAIPADLEPLADHDGGIALEWERGRLSFFATIEADGGLYLCRIGRWPQDDVDRGYDVFDAAVLKAFYDTGRIEATDGE
ncbi:hypothetical protein FG87_21905 [Nocardia vulneris]|uniref:Transposase n=1 Tax=Nocardia vulneris TaxID=1141657 RepID=A0ABR4ZCE1_9NOCA|nr:hypothetical protein FG87_21905 [Nocardia vulneris]